MLGTFLSTKCFMINFIHISNCSRLIHGAWYLTVEILKIMLGTFLSTKCFYDESHSFNKLFKKLRLIQGVQYLTVDILKIRILSRTK